MNFRCPVVIDIKIKLITARTVRSDPQNASHPCFVTITGEHNHHQSAAALRELQVVPGTREDFFQYFEAGELTCFEDYKQILSV